MSFNNKHLQLIHGGEATTPILQLPSRVSIDEGLKSAGVMNERDQAKADTQLAEGLRAIDATPAGEASPIPHEATGQVAIKGAILADAQK